ncbi:MAG: phosphodiester glycosidase family protein [Candidatus Pacebacteria bacterium]|nr:phosphodiester glycosidase family protein [Candidatus Paceibacterota bacterium]
MKEIDFSKYKRKRSRSKTFKRWLKIIFLFILALVLIAGLLIKFNAPLAADIADNYLRPIIGDNTVIFIENTFFNISDKADSLIYKFKQPMSPQFLDQGKNIADQTSLDLTPIPVNNTFKPLSGEGVWNDLELSVFPKNEVLADTFIRPDPQRSFAIVSVVQIDTKLLRIGAVAGTKEPGGSLGNFGTGLIPEDILNSGNLVAAFNGGFLYADGKYGMIVGNKTYAPLKINTGTIVGYADGTVKIINYTGNNLGTNVIFARQNGPLIVDNNQEATLTPADYKTIRGTIYNGKEIVPNGTFTYRSGIGITKTGNLLYAVGNNLSPTSLADALQMAGAVSAIQLDINPSHIHFYTFSETSPGMYAATFLNTELAKLNRSAEYFIGSQRDFFYLYKK